MESRDFQREYIEWCDIWIEDGDQERYPRVLMIGDSITRSYFDWVSKALTGKASCARLATSKFAADPSIQNEIRLVLEQYPFAVIHFNNGLHGMDHPDTLYAEKLPELLGLLHSLATNAQIIWASSTPWRKASNLHELDERNARVVLRNHSVLHWVERFGIAFDDLYGAAIGHPEYYADDGIHFNEAGQRALAGRVTDSIIKGLAKDQA